jgi:hypothetical protein
MGFLAAGSILLTQLGDNYISLLPGFILIGIGVGLQITPATELAIDSAGVGEGTASGAFKATSMIGGSLGVAAATAVFQGKAGNIFDEKWGAGSLNFLKQYSVGRAEDVKHLLDFMTGSFMPDGLTKTSSIYLQAKELVSGVFVTSAGQAMWVASGAALIGIVTSVVLLKGSKGYQGSEHGGH